MKTKQQVIRLLKVIVQIVCVLAITATFVFLWKTLRLQYGWLPEWPVGDALAFIAICFAIVQFIDAKRQELKMTTIALSMSTRFIGAFPKELKDLAALASKAERRIDIIVDFLGHGQYASPEGYSAYLREIENALGKNVEIRMICYDRRLTEKERVEQFPDSAQFEGILDKRQFERYFEIYAGVPRPTDNSGLRETLRLREQHNTEILVAKGLRMKFLSEPADFFMWLGDDQDAVFAFKNIWHKDRGLSFRTQDANLVRQFSDTFDRRWNAPDA